jgi:hypothetical protein
VIARRKRMTGRCALSVFAIWLAGTRIAATHAGEEAVILLLPTEFYIIGGAAAVLVSFCVLVLFHRTADKARSPAIGHAVPRSTLRGISLLSLALLIFLTVAGLAGKTDPLVNPLPLVVWTLWWMGFTLAVVIAGNLWTVVNPWIGLYDLLPWRAPLSYPESWGYLPAIVLFLCFAWFELVYVTPQDPQRLAIAVAAYWLVNFASLAIFGPRWLARGEAFSVFYAMAGSFSAWRWRTETDGKKPSVTIGFGWPGQSGDEDFANLTGVLFILVTLASVSFDGLSRTFTWMGWLGVNPLEFPGRSAVFWQNSAGLIGSIIVLSALYALAIALGPRRTGLVASQRAAVGSFALTLVPISIAYHLAHYLPSLTVGFPSAILALADPLGSGRSLLPEGMLHESSPMGLGHDMVVLIYRVQTAIIVVGHIVATLTAHRIALAETDDRRKAVISEIPLALLMVGYTLFGLWLLSTPQIG